MERTVLQNNLLFSYSVQYARCDFRGKFHANEAIFKPRKNQLSGGSHKQHDGLKRLIFNIGSGNCIFPGFSNSVTIWEIN
jgi:hypothetical protein